MQEIAEELIKAKTYLHNGQIEPEIAEVMPVTIETNCWAVRTKGWEPGGSVQISIEQKNSNKTETELKFRKTKENRNEKNQEGN